MKKVAKTKGGGFLRAVFRILAFLVLLSVFTPAGFRLLMFVQDNLPPAWSPVTRAGLAFAATCIVSLIVLPGPVRYFLWKLEDRLFGAE